MRTTVSNKDSVPAELVEKIAAADGSLRQIYAGFDVHEVVPEVERTLATLGITLPDAAVRAYAQDIADRADHELVVPA